MRITQGYNEGTHLDSFAIDLAGKDAVFAVEIKEIREPKPVVIDDEFAVSLGEKDLDSLRAKVVERIKADYEIASKMKLKRALLDVLDKEYSFDVPQKLTDAEYDGIVKQYEQAKKYNQLDEYEKSKDEKDLLAEYKEIASRRVKLGLLLSEVGMNAKINIAPEDINKAIAAEARKYPGQEKAVFDYYLKNKEAVEANISHIKQNYNLSILYILYIRWSILNIHRTLLLIYFAV